MSARFLLGAAAVALFAAQPALAAPDCAPADLSALAGWEGVWAAEGNDAAAQGLSGRSGQADYKLIGLDAPWNEAGLGRLAAMLQFAGGGDVKQAGWGFPMMMDSFSEFTFVVGPRRTAVVNQYREVRTIYTDGRGHLTDDEIWATNWGDSVGCWEGDTLVVDTIGVRFDPVFNMAAPPLSDQAHFVERIRMVEPGRMENVMTITDPVYLERPWTLRLEYVDAGIERLVLDSYDDRNDTVGGTITASGRTDLVPVALPPNVSLTQAQLDAVAGRYQIEGAPFVIGFERRGDRLVFIPPGLDGGMIMFAQGPLEFRSLAGEHMLFEADVAGRVNSVNLDGPRGPAKATRLAP